MAQHIPGRAIHPLGYGITGYAPRSPDHVLQTEQKMMADLGQDIPRQGRFGKPERSHDLWFVLKKLLEPTNIVSTVLKVTFFKKLLMEGNGRVDSCHDKLSKRAAKA